MCVIPIYDDADSGSGTNEDLSRESLEEQRKASAAVKKQAQDAKATTPKTMRSNSVEAYGAATERLHGVQSTFLASRLEGSKRGGNNLGE